MPFSKLGLPPVLINGVKAMGYVDPTPIQLRAIPVVLGGGDLIGSAQTGTGKTAAFALPVLARLGAHQARGPRVLVLEPTRELAAQVETAFRDFGRFTDIRATVVHGGVGYGRQRSEIQAGTDIVIATPGRLMDFLNEGTLRLEGLQILILDEVDRMLDMGFVKDVKKIIARCPRERQTLFFSATIPPEIDAIASFALRAPTRVEIGVSRTVNKSVTHAFYPVNAGLKFDLLVALLAKTDFHSCLVFSRTKHGADKIARKLKAANHSVAVLHANRSQSQRVEALEGFKSGKYEVMVATDIAARGIDVAGVSHVINYDIPANPEDYVHRIGRTGRALAIGDAFTLTTPEQADEIRAIERFIGQKVPQLKLDGFNYAAQPARPPGFQGAAHGHGDRFGQRHQGQGRPPGQSHGDGQAPRSNPGQAPRAPNPQPRLHPPTRAAPPPAAPAPPPPPPTAPDRRGTRAGAPGAATRRFPRRRPHPPRRSSPGSAQVRRPVAWHVASPLSVFPPMPTINRLFSAALAALLLAVPAIRLPAADTPPPATPAAAAAPAETGIAAEFKVIFEKITAKLKAGQGTEADLKAETAELDALLARYSADKSDEAAMVALMKARLYLEVFENTTKGVALLKELKLNYPDSEVAKNIDQAIAAIEKQAAMADVLAVGKPFPAFAEKDLDGAPLALENFKGKVVLIDFWATWCGPCVQELPNVIAAYEKFHAKGFEIIGVSLDQKRETLTDFIKAKQMPWVQYFDGLGWKNKLAEQYGIQAIPATFLVNGEGVIIAKDLRGPALAEKLATLLK